MAQNRKAPAYQEYAASMLANKNFRLMTLQERGLLYSLRLECWENKQIPSIEIELAKYLGCEVGDLQSAFTDKVKSMFSISGNYLTCPELDDYRQHIESIRLSKSQGGKNSANQRKAKKLLESDLKETCKTLVKLNQAKTSQGQSLDDKVVIDPFVSEYERASNGV
jgi:hypothetical protein